jgi:hypothetical protein
MIKHFPDSEKNLLSLQANPEETTSTLYRHIASGGDIMGLCDIFKVNYADFMFWFRKDSERSKVLDTAFTDRNEWFKETVLSEARKLATFDAREVFDDEGKVKDPSEWSDAVASMVANMSVTYDGDGNPTYKVTMWKKEKALELLGKSIKMFIDRIDHSGKMSLEDLVTKSYE